jgi:hypothetical protein
MAIDEHITTGSGEQTMAKAGMSLQDSDGAARAGHIVSQGV